LGSTTEFVGLQLCNRYPRSADLKQTLKTPQVVNVSEIPLIAESEINAVQAKQTNQLETEMSSVMRAIHRFLKDE
jgi:hypothetical protein